MALVANSYCTYAQLVRKIKNRLIKNQLIKDQQYFYPVMDMSDKLLKHATSCIALLVFCQILGQTTYGQTSEQTRSKQNDTSQTNAPQSRNENWSDLAKDNSDRVAATSLQIRDVLIGNAGLMVELKHWVAKEATDNGQVVDDANMTDQAIFERLDSDVVFRAVATRLVQRYGYLLPTPNPTSTLAKEQDFLVQERVRHFVKMEEEEDNAPLKSDRDLDRTGTGTGACDPQQDKDCEPPAPRKPRTTRSQDSRPPGGDSNPGMPTDLPPSISPSQMLRTELPGSGTGQREGLSSPDLELASSSLKSGTSSTLGSQIPDFSAAGDLSNASVSPLSLDKPSNRATSPRNDLPLPRRYPTEKAAKGPLADVRTANPYADVPSLYDLYVQAAVRQHPLERFGFDVFRDNANQPDVIPMDLPVGPDYVVGTGDSLSIDLWGSISQRLVRLVDREGRISLPETGPLLVSGKSLGEAQIEVQRALRTQFTNVSADVSLSRLRTVRVYVVGEVTDPGAYDISSLSTPLNALFAAGGVTAQGSLRALKHYRGKQLIEQVDAYDLLLHGVRSDMQRLENGDTLLVPPMGPQVTVDGMVRRPAVYEVLDENSLAEVLQLAGGILPTATLRHVEVQRIEAHEKRTMLSLDLTGTDGPQFAEPQPVAAKTVDPQQVSQQLQSFKIRDGDQIHIFPIASFNQDTIYLQGHVLRPGRYSYKPGMKLTDLISSYADLLPEPAPHYAEIVRLNPPDFHPSVESFDVAAALANPAAAPALKPLDTVRIFSRYDFERPPDVWVTGEVRSPGQYRTSGQAHLRDAIYLAGGITPDAAQDSAQLFRTQADGTMTILSVDLHEALAGNPLDNIILQPRDRLLIHRNLAKVDAPTVYIRGEVAKPGRYPLTSNMRVEDLVRVAGGVKRSAFTESADLTRFAAGNGTAQRFEVKLGAALSGNGNEDLPLRNGDLLAVRRIPQWNDLGASVTVKGEVQHPATYGIEPGERLSSVLMRCNGFTPQAYPYGAVLIRQEVREVEMRSHLELVTRLKTEQSHLQILPETDADQKTAKLEAIARTETALRQLEGTAPVGRLVIHITPDLSKLAKSPADTVLRDGDILIIPKKNNYILVSGEVFNPTAVSYRSGRSAKWYLSQSGGLTQIADKNAVFVVRADGSVLAARNNSGFWSGDPMNAVLKAGDSIIVPEKAPRIAPRNWATLLQAAQVASSAALTVAYIHP
jgi:polysaccharide export outer membrane protein